MKVALFIPCFVDQLFPDTAFNMVKVLEKAGCTVHYNTAQTCCGQPGYNAGYWQDAKEVGEKFIKDFEAEEYVVAPSGSCVGYVRNCYEKLFEDSAYFNAVKQLQQTVFEFSEFMVDVLQVEDVGASLPGKATYHDACGALRECRIKSAPRKLLQQVRDLELIEMKDVETCCGFGGTFSIKYEPISIGMADQKIENATATGADYLISTDPSCLMHLNGYIKHQTAPLKTMHIADVLASGWN